MIRLVLVFNTAGKPRLVKFYDRVDPPRQARILRRTADLVLARARDACNFLDPDAAAPGATVADETLAELLTAGNAAAAAAAHGGGGGGRGDGADPGGARDLDGGAARGGAATGGGPAGELAAAAGLKVVYRMYATLCFAMVVDAAESEIAILDLIQVLVEALDRVFPNVCELDLVFHFDCVHMLLAEVIQGGLVLETSVSAIVASYHATHAAAAAGGTMTSAPAPGSAGAAGAGGAAAATPAATIVSSPMAVARASLAGLLGGSGAAAPSGGFY